MEMEVKSGDPTENPLLPEGEGGAGDRNVWSRHQRKHHVVEHDDVTDDAERAVVVADEISNTRKYLSVFVLFLINLLNYMDRFTIAGVLLQIQEYFNISNGSAGLLQTVFIVSYMAVAPLFGYLGDRYNRRAVMLVGMVVWSGCTLGASFIYDRTAFGLFLAMRGLVGVGEASYSTIAPTIIADLFVKSQRTRMLSVFFFAIPVGSGLGYVVGSGAAKAFRSWHWALRVTPVMGVITMILMVIILPDVKRGASETLSDLMQRQELEQQRSSYLDDLKYIFRNKSFMFVCVGFTFMAFVVGSLSLWGPVFVAYSQVVAGLLEPCTSDECEYSSVSFTFGILLCVSGFFGVWIGAEWAKRWKEKGQENADALVCAIGLLVTSPALLVGFEMASVHVAAAWACIFVAELTMCFTWTLVGDITLYVTMPSRRSTANAVQILFLHLFGDAGSPYLLGVMSDALMAGQADTYLNRLTSLHRSMYVTLFAGVLSGAGFLAASLFVVGDKKVVDDALKGKTSPSPSNASSDSVELNRINHDRTCTTITLLPADDVIDDVTNRHDEYLQRAATSPHVKVVAAVDDVSPHGQLAAADSSPGYWSLGVGATSQPEGSSTTPSSDSRDSVDSDTMLLADAKESHI